MEEFLAGVTLHTFTSAWLNEEVTLGAFAGNILASRYPGVTLRQAWV